MNGHTDSVLLTRNMTQSNSFTSPAKRERTLVNNTHRHSLPPNVSLKSPIQRRNAISSPSNRMVKLPNVVETASVPNFQYKLTCVIREAHNQSFLVSHLTQSTEVNQLIRFFLLRSQVIISQSISVT
ncbi:unnamed protein product [Heterobilharzia americana]|nr:unnamed protein product [Heterobilharzia americana]